VETIGSKRSYALIWCMPNNDDDDDVVTAGGRGWGVSLLSRLEGLGEHCKLPQRGPGQSPGRKTSFGVFRV